jgi:putative transposase
MEIREMLLPGSTYHICTRANGEEELFRDGDDYAYFNQSLRRRMAEVWEIISWVYLPQELHLVIRIKENEDKPISHAHFFGHVLNGYVQHYNRKYYRQGSLLNRSFRRKLIKTQEELKDIICLVDNLPVARDLVSDKTDWKYGSYAEFSQSNFASEVARSVITTFNDAISFITHHMKEGLLKSNILPRRIWASRWTTASADPPFG